MKKYILLFFTLLFSTSVFSQVEYTKRLSDKVNKASSDDFIRVLCLLRDRVDIAALDKKLYAQNASIQKRAYEVITQLMEKAEITQKDLINYIKQKQNSNSVKSYQSFWVTNLIMVEAKKSIIEELLTNPQIEFMDIDAELSLDPYIDEGPAQMNITGSEIGLRVVGADKLWKLGITGFGRLVMDMDTGVDPNHPAFASRWRGLKTPLSHAWFDPAGSTTPSDCDGHGTHTMGIMVGQSNGDTVGMAPDAEWIAAKTICTSPITSNCIAGFQWSMNPDGNPNTTNDMPDVINNSWYDSQASSTQCTGIYKTTLDAVEAAGIAVVWSAGNNGPNASTITAPKNINTDLVNVFCVANINGNVSGYPIASSSSRGPSTCGGTGSLLIKPEVSAPGTSVRSSIPNGQYGLKTGTSMASPHAAGAVALLKQAFPHLTGHQIKLALYNTATDLGVAGEDNTYGMGLLNVYAAYLSLIDTTGTITSTITTDSSWNLISLPVQPNLQRREDIFPTSNSYAYSFNNYYIIKDSLEIGYGYWLKFPSQMNHQITGKKKDSISVQLSTGWNLIGALSDSINVTSLTTVPPNLIASEIYGYQYGYHIANYLRPGKGYWVKSNGNGKLILKTSMTKIPDDYFDRISNDWVELIITDNQKRSSKLFLAILKDSKRFELPPIPPKGLFDVRFMDNSLIANPNEQSFISFNSAAYPIEIKIANTDKDFIVEDLINGKYVNQRLTSSNPVIISNSAISSVKISPINQIVNYSLEQNFPNPFNPKTVIKFSIPQKEHVSLKLYNAIGEELMSLVNQELEAGYHQVELNNKNLPTGIYFYKMTAGTFVKSKKLILLK